MPQASMLPLSPAALDLLASIEASSFQAQTPAAHVSLARQAHELLTSLEETSFEVSSLETRFNTAATPVFAASLASSLLQALSPAARGLLALVAHEYLASPQSTSALTASPINTLAPSAPLRNMACHFCGSYHHRAGECTILCSYCKGRACPRALDITLLCTSWWTKCPDYKINPIANAVGGVFGRGQTDKQASAWRLVTYDRAHANRIYGRDVSSTQTSEGARVTLLKTQHAEVILGGVIDVKTPELTCATVDDDNYYEYNGPLPKQATLVPEILVTQQPAFVPQLVPATKVYTHENAHGVYFSFDPVPFQFDPRNHSLPLAMQALGRRSTACEEADAVNAQWEAYNRFSQPERDEILSIATKLEATSVFMTSSIYKAVAPFIRFAPVANRDVWALLRQELAEFDRGIHVFGGSIDGHHNDAFLCVFSPDDEEALKIMKKRIKFMIKRVTQGLEWGQSIIEDTLLYGTPRSDAGVPINTNLWQPAINTVFDESREKLIDCYIAIRFFYGNLRYSRLLLVQEVMRDEQLQPVEQFFDQEVPPDEYEFDNDSPTHKT